MAIERIENLIKKLKTRKVKNIIYTIVISVVVGVFCFRFYTVAQEKNRSVFNITRNNIEHGTPVTVMKIQETDGILYEPLNIKNNKAYVSGARVKLFFAGQSLGDCQIISVSHGIDLDSGMHLIKTKKCSDGLKYAQQKRRGFYVPVSAVFGNVVYVVKDGVAHARDIIVVARDSQNVLIKSGIQNDDIIVLSNVKDNEKIQVVK